MKCKDCSACKKGWFQSRPDAYVCTGVLEPFVIEDVCVECTQYKERRDYDINEIIFQLKCIKEHQRLECICMIEGIIVGTTFVLTKF